MSLISQKLIFQEAGSFHRPEGSNSPSWKEDAIMVSFPPISYSSFGGLKTPQGKICSWPSQ